MKRLFALLLSLVVLVPIPACADPDAPPGTPAPVPAGSSLEIKGTDAGVADFLAVLGDTATGYADDTCYNITPDKVSGAGFQVFKFDQSCASFLLYGGRAYKLGENFGGLGVVDMAAADLNGDGTQELYFTFSWGSGIHRSQLGYFDPAADAVTVFDYARMDSDMALYPGADGGLSVHLAELAMTDFVNYTVAGGTRLGAIAYRGGEIALGDELAPAETEPEAEAVMTVKIMRLGEGSLLLAGTEGAELYTLSSNLEVRGPDGAVSDASALRAGQIVEVGYSGAIMESYPAQFGAPAYIRIKEQGDDLAGFYLGVLGDLWNVDPGLNGGISVLAFDLGQVTNLTEAEKSALVYMMSGDHRLMGVTGTFDELCEQGYIDREHLYFETGLLFEFRLSDVTETGFTFSAVKWRSGLGAYFFGDCEAVRSDEGVWSYTIGSEAIA